MKKILLISFFPPTKNHAGGARILDLYNEMKTIYPGLSVVLVTCDEEGVDSSSLDCMFDGVYRYSRSEFAKSSLAKLRLEFSHFDIVDLQYHQSGSLINNCRSLWPDSVIIFTPMESQIRALLIYIFRSSLFSFLNIRKIFGLLINSIFEFYFVSCADKVITVSNSDRNIIAHFKDKSRVTTVPTCISPHLVGMSSDFTAESHDLSVVFFAFFGSQTNKDALIWFTECVHPLLCKSVPNYRLRIVGNGVGPWFSNNSFPSKVDIVGSVGSVSCALSNAAIGIAPAVHGAGIRGKIHQYSVFGLPCVASEIACESLSYIHGESIFIANSAKEFAECCISLLRDKSLRERIGRNARLVCERDYQWPAWRKEISSVYELNSR